MAFRRKRCLPGEQVFSEYLTDASERLDVKAAATKISRGFQAVSSALGLGLELQTSSPCSAVLTLDPKATAALRRLQQRAPGAELLQLLFVRDAEQWEQAFCSCFASGKYLDLSPDTLQEQVVQEYRVCLLIGRSLQYPAGSDSPDGVGVVKQLQYSRPDGVTALLSVDLLFPATRRSVERVIQYWWDAKGGKPSTRREVAALRQSTPEHRARPVRFYVMRLQLLYWQAELMTCLQELNAQMLANKATGVANWYHPASLGGNGGSYPNGSLPQRAQHAALAMLAFCWAIHRGGRPAELFRMRWYDASIMLPGQEMELPLFVLGLSSLFPQLQQAAGSGWWFKAFHCKFGYDYGVPDCIDLLPPTMSGLDFAACYQLAFVVVTFLQPRSPAKPITRKRPAPGQQPQTFNNASGFVFGQYGGLKHVVPPDLQEEEAQLPEAMAKVVNGAISCASFLSRGWEAVRARGDVQVDCSSSDSAVHNNPSVYSARSMHAGEFCIMQQQLNSVLPPDVWVLYMQLAARSEASESWKVYRDNYEAAFGSTIPYQSNTHGAYTPITYKTRLLGRDPTLANQEALRQQQDQLAGAVHLGKLYLVNKCTPSIWEHLIGLVQTKGSLAGMLAATSSPLCHSGYHVAPLTRTGCDLQYIRHTPAAAAALSNEYIATIHSGSIALYGSLPAAPARPVLLQGVVDLLCMDADAARSAFAAPGMQLRQSMAAAAAALVSVLSSTAAVAQAGVRGDEGAAARAAGQAAAAALQAARGASLLQQAMQLAETRQVEVEGPGGEEACPAAEQSQEGIPSDMDWHAVASDLAEEATQLAHPPAASPLLPKGGGALLLLPSGKRWQGKGLELGGTFTCHGQQFTRYCIAQVMKPLLLTRSEPQQVSFRIAAECLAQGEQLTGSWSKHAYTLCVDPGSTLLLPCQPRHAVKERFRAASEAARSHTALFGTWFNEAAVSGALGRLALERRPQRACVVVQQQQPAVAGASLQPLEVESGAPGGMAAQSAAAGQQSILDAAVAAVTKLSTALNAAEADQHFVAVTAVVLPLLRGSSEPELAASVREGLHQLHAAAATGTALNPTVLQSLLAGLRALATPHAPNQPAAATGAFGTAELAGASHAAAAAPAADGAAARGKCKPPKAGQQASPAAEQPAWLQQQPCGGCADPAGEQVLCDYCLASWHLGCHTPALSSVPPGTWLCAACSGVEGRLAETESALALHGSWVQAKAARVRRLFFGQLSYSSHAKLALMFEDAEQWDGLTVEQAEGTQPLEGYTCLRPAERVPHDVVQLFEGKGWLVTQL